MSAKSNYDTMITIRKVGGAFKPFFRREHFPDVTEALLADFTEVTSVPTP